MSYGLFLGIEGQKPSDARLANYVTELADKIRHRNSERQYLVNKINNFARTQPTLSES
jgi:hypothetical protein